MPSIVVNTKDISQKYNNLGSPYDYINLMKPRVMSLVVFTAFVGYYNAVPVLDSSINPFLALIGIFAIALGAGASGVLNQWYDKDIDVLMDRTKNRPIASGKIQPSEALSFGVITSILSIIILGLSINWLAASLLAFTIFFYAVVYTIWLKRYTVQNIVIGGAAGAFPPIIGHICATGSIGIEALILFLIIFLWTPPHFWALALKTKLEYKLVNIPMLPNVKGDKSTKWHIFLYTLILVIFSTLPYFFDFNSIFYLAFSLSLGFKFIFEAYNLLKIKNYDERKVFNFSIIYLFLIFSLILIDKIIVRLI